MEIRVLEYFLAVAREQSITGAAQVLHMSQPTLSRQLKDMEEELGKQLIVRGNRKITLTEDGMLLRKRAEEITELVHKTEQEIALSNDTIAGDIYIGSGETCAVRYLVHAAQNLQQKYPGIHYHMVSGDTQDVTEQLTKGLIDFGLLFDPIDLSNYDFITLPVKNTWGVLMPKDSLLAQKETIFPEDLTALPLIISRHAENNGFLSNWFQKELNQLNIKATYNLVNNASLMVSEGMGYALTLDNLINTTGNSDLCFRSLSPTLQSSIHIVWKKYQVLTRAAEKYLEELQEINTFTPCKKKK